MSDEPSKPQQPAEPAGQNVPDAQPAAPDPAATTQPTGPAVGQPVATASGADAPPPPPPPPPGQAAAAPRGGFGRFVRHRATQIVAAGLVGVLIGGGVVALVDRDGHPGYYYRGDSRGGFDRGPYRDGPYRDGPDFREGPRQELPRRGEPRPQQPTPPTQPTQPSAPSAPSTGTTPG